jgi:bifunctional non-homologous end joining protein LigD
MNGARLELPEIRPVVPHGRDEAMLAFGSRRVRLTNLRKVFWPELDLTKGMLLQYYLDVAEVLLPHLIGRAMVMKRWPNGVNGKFFFMKRAPVPRPSWVRTCVIEHDSGNVIEFPVIDDVASLAWLVNLACIDLNPWYSRCDDVDRPDYLHFDLDPGAAPFDHVREAGLVLRDALSSMGMPVYVKTSGSKGLHVYVPIVRGPTQQQVWAVSKTVANELARRHPRLLTAEYRIARRPAGRVLVDYNQNAWGRTLASVYSVRPTSHATVSMPVTWAEIEEGAAIDDFRMDNARARIRRRGDLWAPLAPGAAGRFDLGRME